MEITEVRIKLMEEPSERLQAFCSITFDNAFVIRDLKIIEGNKGSFVAMPSRKLTDRCPRCSAKNHLRALYCNQCGLRLPEDRAVKDTDGRAKLHADIAHPINSASREAIQRRVLEAFQEELGRSKLPGYVPSYDDFDYDDADGDVSERATVRKERETVPSYRDVISRLEGENQAAQGPHRRHAGHQRQEERSSEAEPRDTFGAGIL